jgi:hypothetical protein
MKKVRANSGQAMLLAVLALGGAVLSATTIAGFLMAYQIRETTDFANSAKAIFAADAGTEWALYSHFVNSSTAMMPFSNGATNIVACADVNGAAIPCGDGSADSATSKGFAVDSARAFLLTFGGASSTGQ